MVKFRPRGMVDKREMEQAQLFETADERGCTPMFSAAHRRGSASIGGMRVCSLCIGAGLDYSVSMKSSLKPDGEAIMKWNPSGPPHFRLSCFMTARMRAGLSFGPET